MTPAQPRQPRCSPAEAIACFCTLPRAWDLRAVSEEFERRLAEPQGPAIAVYVDSWVRRGRDYLQVVIVARVEAADVADALDLAWQALRKAAGDDAAGWDLPAATAEVRPGMNDQAQRRDAASGTVPGPARTKPELPASARSG